MFWRLLGKRVGCVDFGSVCVSQVLEKRLTLECSIPVSFDFEVAWIHSSDNFEVSPNKGSIPANGSTEIVVRFKPDRLCLSTCTFQLIIHEYHLRKCVCDVVGSSIAGVTRQKKIEEVTKAHRKEVSDRVEKLKQELTLDESSQEHFNNKDASAYVRVHNDILHASIDKKAGWLDAIPFTTYSVANRFERLYDNDPGSHVIREIHARAQKAENAEESPRSSVEGQPESLDFPENLTGVTAANYVLTQEPGKLKLKNLKLAIAKQRELKEEREKEKEQLLKLANESNLDRVTQILADDKTYNSETSSRQMKELVFVQQLRDIEKEERSLDFSTQKQHLGQPLLPEEDIEKIEETRQLAAEQKLAEGRERDRTMFDTRQQREQIEETGSQQVLVQRAEFLSYEHEETRKFLAGMNPTFDIADNEDFFMRKRTTMRFIHLVSKIVIKNRACKRLRDIWGRIGDVRDKAAIVELVKQDNVDAAQQRKAGKTSARVRSERDEEEWKKYKEKVKSLPFVRKRRYSVETDASGTEGCEDSKAPGKSQPDAKLKDIEDDAHIPPCPPERIEDAFFQALPVNPASISTDAIESRAFSNMGESVKPRYFHYPIFEEPTVLSGDETKATLLRGFYKPTYFTLQQPEEYKLLGYSEYEIPLAPEASIYYVSDEELKAVEPPHRCVPTAMQAEGASTQIDRILSRELDTQDLPLPNVMEAKTKTLCFERTANLFHEADPQFSLLPREVEYGAQENLEYKWARTPGMYAVRALSTEPTISDFVRPRTVRIHHDLEGIETAAVSAQSYSYLTGPLDDDIMSDPGEDDEFLSLKKASKEAGDDDVGCLRPGTIRARLTPENAMELLLERPFEAEPEAIQHPCTTDEQQLLTRIQQDREDAAAWLPAQLGRINNAITNEKLKFNIN